MFIFMNSARIGVAGQGVAHAELASQAAYQWASERRSGRFADGPRNPESVGDLIIHHPDVKRMVFTSRAFADGGRWLLYRCARAEDAVEAYRAAAKGGAGEAALKKSREMSEALAFLTPVAKGFLTECGVEAASHAIQVYGGMGYVRETGVEQIFRDARIAPIYEGTTGVQAMDLIGRKMMADGLASFDAWVLDAKRSVEEAKKIVDEIRSQGGNTEDAEWLVQGGESLLKGISAFSDALRQIESILKTDRRRSAMMSAATDTLYGLGYLVLGQGWVDMSTAALKKKQALAGSAAGEGNEELQYLAGKLTIGQFYLERLMPRVYGHIATIKSADSSLLGKEHSFLAVR